MNIVQINDVDLLGRRFNGYDLQADLNRCGHRAHQVVIDKLSDDPNIIALTGPAFTLNHQAYINFEKRLSMHGLIYPYGRRIMAMPEFQAADIVHYHLVHNHLISLLDLADMMELKPSVWTLHDPWAITGHCIHPKDCDKWQTGCNQCPHLDSIFPMHYDKAYQMWNVKKSIYSRFEADIVVASKFMLNLVRQSPLMAELNVHYIPFGIRLTQFAGYDKMTSRAELGVPSDHFVIAVRAHSSEFKGLKYVFQMLECMNPSMPISILTVGQKGLFDRFDYKYTIVDLDWITDERTMAMFYSASDVFLMPSTAESFGLMAIEAMASSRPVVVFDGTALADTTFAPECGVLVAQGDVNGLRQAVEGLMTDPAERLRRGLLGRELAERHYGYDKYLSKMVNLYEDVAIRRKS